MLEVAGLTKRYGSRHAVDDVSFEVAKGEIVGFLGPNGAGKSTTLRMITGFIAPTAGSVRIAGIDALGDPQKARQAFGYMPEGVPLYPDMRVIEYLQHRAELKGVSGKTAIAADAALERAGVKDARDRIIGQLSKGYRQRVGLADALLGDPALLILDEPTSGLDPNQIRHVRDMIRSFAGDKTVFLSTHILPEVEASCGRVVIIDEGRVVGEGDPRTLRGRAGGARLVHFIGLGTTEAYRRALEGMEVVALDALAIPGEAEGVRGRVSLGEEARVEDVFRAIAAAGLALRELRSEAASLEEVFTSLTTEERAAEGDEDEDEAESAGENESGNDDEEPS